MKLTVVFLTVALLNVSAKGISQSISFSADHASLKEVFAVIKKQTGYVVLYNKAYLNETKPVSLSAANMPLKIFLEQVFKDQPLNYSMEGNTISLSRKMSALPKNVDDLIPPIKISGTVLGINNQPLIGATVRVKGKNIITTTNEQGYFELSADGGSILVISYVGFEPTEYKITTAVVASSDQQPSNITEIRIILQQSNNTLDTTAVYSTGYQSIPKERSTGSFVQINNELYNRRISTDVLTKLDGITSGVYFNNSGNSLNSNYGLANVFNDPQNKLGITIRGQNTLANQVSKDPLIVVDNFPYEGDINNLNPEMIESITILKDAAAASIWGARSGNGVIVITTKKGKYNQKLKVDVNANFTIIDRPDIYADQSFLNSNDYINIEDTLFSKGFFDFQLSDPGQTVLSPVIEIRARQKANLITSTEADNQIDALRKIDVRRDYHNYIYQKSIKEQYAFTIRGGGNNLAYALSAGYDDNKNSLVNNTYRRFSINSQNTYTPFKNFEATVGITYNRVDLSSNNTFGWRQGGLIVSGNGVYYNLFPYAQLAGTDGTHMAITKNYRTPFIDSVQRLGFLDWRYRPLDEIELADNTTGINHLIIKAGMKYKMTSFLSADIQYQIEKETSISRVYRSQQTYYTRDLINQFTQYNPLSSPKLNYPFPLGGILMLSPNDLSSKNLRGQLNFNNLFNRTHSVTAILGIDVREITIDNYLHTSYGYNDQYGTGVTNLNFTNFYNLNPSGSNTLPSIDGNVSKTTNRYISYFSNIGYNYRNRYTLTLSARRDGANIFGVKTNDKITPLWSMGLGWNINQEHFYNVSWLPYLRVRATYGYNGNVYNGSAYLIAQFRTSNSLNPTLPLASISVPPNPQLSWEKVRNINIGIDFSGKNSRISGTVEFYQKSGLNLIEPVPLAPSTGFALFNGNAASTRTKGIDITLDSRIVDGRFKWLNTLLLSTLKDKVTKYDVKQNSSSIQTGAVALLGKPLYGVYSYKWAGLDPVNGDPQGFLNKGISKDYNAIINNYNPDSLVFNGSARPTIFGSFRNTFSYAQFSLSVNIVYKLSYVFRRPSTSLNYEEIIFSGAHSDYSRSWQKPGDESNTNVPSLIYPSNNSRNTFYRYSEILVEKGDHVRLQDISLAYDFQLEKSSKAKLSSLQLYIYLNNLGIIWKANNKGIDPDSINGLPNPKSISFGIKANL